MNIKRILLIRIPLLLLFFFLVKENIQEKKKENLFIPKLEIIKTIEKKVEEITKEENKEEIKEENKQIVEFLPTEDGIGKINSITKQKIFTDEEILNKYNIDVSTFTKKYSDEGILYYEDSKGVIYLFGEEIYPSVKETFEYTNAMNLKIDEFVNDFTNQVLTNKDKNDINKILQRSFKKTNKKTILVILPSKENNTFDDLYYQALLKNKNQNIDNIIFLIKENQDLGFRYKKLDGKITDEFVNGLLYGEEGLQRKYLNGEITQGIEIIINKLNTLFLN